ncbi:phytoene desaturase family protein [Paenibacillus crassostreae]|uniref:phytoene desaturase family protein n=1 Tax=Paenibacillus crassostreae TaxID=1763538 RepID=UPI001E5599C8|nr:NAD(P)/FAD-dependent oxidoreductase [Paenibacillus crassostreae]
MAIIGSGFAGMTAAVLLAQKGYRTTVFERHYRLGGYGHSFRRKGFEFHTSIYKIPSQWNGLMEVMDITFGNDEKMFSTSQYIFEDSGAIISGGNPEHQLIEKFPESSQMLTDFFTKMKDVGELFEKIFESGYSIKNLKVSEAQTYIEFSKMTISELLDKYFGDQTRLKDMIMATLDFTGDNIALVIPVSLKAVKPDVVDQLPIGGAPRMIGRLKERLIQYGGKVRLREEVTKLEIDDSGVCIRFETNKDNYENFDEIIVASDINFFYDKLLNSNITHDFKKQDYAISESSFSVWLGLNCSYEDLCLPSETVYYSLANKTWDLLSVQEPLVPTSGFLFISGLFSKDPLSTPKGKSQVCIGLPCSMQYFQQCKELGLYEEVKAELGAKLIDIVSELIPNIRDYIYIQEIASPLTYYSYTLNTNGATIGYQKNKNFVLSSKRHKNINKSLRNITFGSQWTSLHAGVMGAMEEGIKATNIVLKRYGHLPYDYMEKLH